LSVGGVKEVNNQLTLADGDAAGGRPAPDEHAAGDTITDALLEARIKIRLLTRGGPEAFHIHVKAAGGVVILSGGVPDEAHLEKALRITLATLGVREIHDLLEVRRPAHRHSEH
jgi:osmotically-inducible protein OsmY